MRLPIAAMVALLIAACAHSPEPLPVPSAAPARHVNPANIKRVRGDLPPGYEVAGVSGVAGPPAIWGLGANWTADPPRCAALVDPLPAHGVSGSGSGGIIYALVSPARTGSVAPDLVAECAHWSMTNGRATAHVQLIEAPRIDGVQTLGMATDTRTPVEGGNEINSQTRTFTAYLDDYYAFTTAVTDPGSAQPPLPARSVAELLRKTVTALRG